MPYHLDSKSEDDGEKEAKGELVPERYCVQMDGVALCSALCPRVHRMAHRLAEPMACQSLNTKELCALIHRRSTNLTYTEFGLR